MPIWEPSLVAAGFTPAGRAVGDPHGPAGDARRELPAPPRPARRHHPDPAAADPERRVDRRPVPDVRSRVLPVRRVSSASPDDVTTDSTATPACRRRSPRSPRSDRPVVLGGARSGAPSPRLATHGREAPVVGDRIRQHPYVRLALNGSFSALWAGQLISIFGDRIHTIALVRHRLVVTGVVGRRPRLRRRDAAEPVPLAVRRHVRRPLGPQGGPGRQRHPAGRPRPADPARGDRQHAARLPAGLPRDLGLDLLPAGAGRDPAADRRGRRARDRQLGDVDRRDRRRRLRVHARRAARGGRSGTALPAGVLARRRDLPRLRGPPGLARGSTGRRPAIETRTPTGRAAASSARCARAACSCASEPSLFANTIQATVGAVHGRVLLGPDVRVRRARCSRRHRSTGRRPSASSRRASAPATSSAASSSA